MKNKKIIFVIILMLGAGGYWLVKGGRGVSSQGAAGKGEVHQEHVEYWTCSMHPQVRSDGPGKCPICGMELIPVHTGDKGKIIVDEHNKEYLEIENAPAEYRNLTKIIRLPGKINHDAELYTLQQEYLSMWASVKDFNLSSSPEVRARQESLLKAAKLRLKLLGFMDEQIAELERRNAPDESLIYPVHGKAWVMADVYEQDLNLVKPGQKVVGRVSGYRGEFTGKIDSIEDVLNSQTRSAKARIELVDLENHLKHEAFVDLILEIELGRRLCVPSISIIDTGTRKVVYVDGGDGRYQLRQIQTGVEAQGFIEVREGLAEGEKVVTRGNFLLDSQTTLTGGQSLLYGGSEEMKEAQPEHRH